ncbi:biopolymer transporter ExbD [Azonexus sp. R2A61]|uniref:ExbD/TolR family protein n=1 Tax=Azonexus sp. R2A61 TaxID=2744443 RepID=UPI001F442B90|nr:biopolymer transporter ExbD [Azonexus sp. R2A61]
MAIAIGAGSKSGEPEIMAEINTTPLIDVMLVLLIMLIITIPIQLHSVNLNMPVGNPPPPSTPPEIVKINVEANGIVLWNGEPLADIGALQGRLHAAALQATQPELHIRPDKKVAYRHVAAVMSAVQREGLSKVGLVGAEQFL